MLFDQSGEGGDDSLPSFTASGEWELAWSYNCTAWNEANDFPGGADVFDVAINNGYNPGLVGGGNATGSGTFDGAMTGQIQIDVVTTQSSGPGGISGCTWTIQVTQM